MLVLNSQPAKEGKSKIVVIDCNRTTPWKLIFRNWHWLCRFQRKM